MKRFLKLSIILFVILLAGCQGNSNKNASNTIQLPNQIALVPKY
jgi:hypothetical protein